MLPSELSAGGLPLLGMGRDVPDGRMFLRNGQLDIDWRKASGSDEYFTRLRNTSRDFATALGGRFADNPLWFLKRVITVHPLGGAPMGRHAGEGVVDAYGNVFGHPGLHIADGSVMPGPDRAQPQLHDRGAGRSLRRPDHRSRPTRRGGGGLMTSSVRFTEEMLGHVTFGEPDFARGAQPDRDGSGCVQVPPDDRGRGHRGLRQRPAAPGDGRRLDRADAFGGKLPVEQGWFNLFVDVEPGVKHMLYRLWFRDGVGHPLTDDRLQAGQGRRRLRRLEGHHDALHARPAGPRARRATTTRRP